MTGGSLDARLSPSEGVSDEELWKWGFQVLLAVQDMHKCAIVHRDIKPSNVMLTDVGDVKVGDLGLAMQVVPRTRVCGDARAMIRVSSYCCDAQSDAPSLR